MDRGFWAGKGYEFGKKIVSKGNESAYNNIGQGRCFVNSGLKRVG